MDKGRARVPRPSQLQLIEKIDQGQPVEQIAASLGKSVLAVRRQLARIKLRVREGQFSPALLPIERAAREPRVYLCGFEESGPDATALYEQMTTRCRARGLVAVSPLEGGASSGTPAKEDVTTIAQACVVAIRSADVVLADLTNLRGACEPGVGTAFEVGVAVALGKPVWAYRTDAPCPLDHRSQTRTVIHPLIASVAGTVLNGLEACLDAIKSSAACEDPFPLQAGLAKR